MKIIRFNAIWCSGCLVMKPIWNKLEQKYPDIEYVNYDYDMDEEMTIEYNVGSILPVAIIISNGKEIKRIIGEKKETEIFEMLEEVINENK